MSQRHIWFNDLLTCKKAKLYEIGIIMATSNIVTYHSVVKVKYRE